MNKTADDDDQAVAMHQQILQPCPDIAERMR